MSVSGDGTSTTRLVKVCAIAQGGMGHVDLVLLREGRFRRLVAVKRLLPHLREETELRTMFLDEGRVAGLIRHPNVVSVLDVGQDEEGPYLVMEYVDGVPLNRLLATLLRAQRRLPLPLAVEIVRQAALGLHAAHEARSSEGQPLLVVHRDVSPHNVLLGYDGVVRLTDFGIAKALGRLSRTFTGGLKGKLGYMSPEQLRFEPLDRRSDLFSLGVVLYEACAGRRLYTGDDGPRRTLSEAPPDLREKRADAPVPLAELVRSMLAKDRAARPPDAQTVVRRLAVIMDELATSRADTDLASFLDELTRPERESWEATVAAAVRALERGEAADDLPTPAHPTGGRRAPPVDPMHDAPTLRASRRAGRRPSLLWTVALLATGAAASIAVLSLARDDAPNREPAASAPPESSSEDAVPAQPVLRSHDADAAARVAPGIDPERERQGAVGSPGPAAALAPPATDAGAPARARRRPHRRRRAQSPPAAGPPAAETSMGARTWDWNE